MDNFMIYLSYSKWGENVRTQTTYSWGTLWIEDITQ